MAFPKQRPAIGQPFWNKRPAIANAFALPGRLSRVSGEPAFDPTQIDGLLRYYVRPAGAIASATDGTGSVADGGAVAYWEDLSGNGQHAKQATADDQMLYRANHVVLGDCLESVSSDFLKWDTPISLQDFTLVCDVSVDNFPNENTVLVGSSAGNNNFIYISRGGADIGINAQGNNYSISFALSTATRYILTIVRSGTATNNIKAYVNNVLVGQTSGNSPLVNVDQLFARGAKFNKLDGACKAVLIYNVALTDKQRTNVYDFLAV